MYSSVEVFEAKASTRSISAMPADTSASRFLLGSNNVKGNSQIFLVDYDSKQQKAYSEHIYPYDGQIWNISSAPFSLSLFCVIDEDYSGVKHAKLVKTNQEINTRKLTEKGPTKEKEEVKAEGEEEEEVGEKEVVSESTESTTSTSTSSTSAAAAAGTTPEKNLDEPAKKELADEGVEQANDCIPDEGPMKPRTNSVAHSSSLSSEDGVTVLYTFPHDNAIEVIWHPGDLEGTVRPRECIILFERGYGGYHVDDDFQVKELFFFELPTVSTAGAWDSLHTHHFAITSGSTLTVRDITNNSIFCEYSCPLNDSLTCVDFNANRPSVVCVGTCLGYIHIIQLKSMESVVLKTIQAHSHIVTSVKFNPLYDQLLMSCGTDNVIALWNIFTVSSSRLKEKRQKDRLVKVESSMTSVYSCAWSVFDSWLYVASSYDGTVYFCHVPKEEVAFLLDYA